MNTPRSGGALPIREGRISPRAGPWLRLRSHHAGPARARPLLFPRRNVGRRRANPPAVEDNACGPGKPLISNSVLTRGMGSRMSTSVRPRGSRRAVIAVTPILWLGVSLIYLGVAACLYALLLLPSRSTGAALAAYAAFGLSVVVVPLAISTYLFIRMHRSSNVRTRETLVLIAPLFLLALGYALSIFRVYAVWFMIPVFVPLAPESVILFSTWGTRGPARRARPTRILALSAFAPSAVVFVLLLGSSGSSQYDQVAWDVSRLLGGADAGFTAFELVAPVFVAYISAGIADMAAFLLLKVRPREKPEDTVPS